MVIYIYGYKQYIYIIIYIYWWLVIYSCIIYPWYSHTTPTLPLNSWWNLQVSPRNPQVRRWTWGAATILPRAWDMISSLLVAVQRNMELGLDTSFSWNIYIYPLYIPLTMDWWEKLQDTPDSPIFHGKSIVSGKFPWNQSIEEWEWGNRMELHGVSWDFMGLDEDFMGT